MDDHATTGAMRAGEAPVGASACARYYGELLKFLTGKLRCREEAADLTQEAFARFFASAAPEAIRRPRAFLYRIARNLVVDASRKRHVRSKHLVGLNEVYETPSQTSRPDQLIEDEQAYRALRQAIVELPPRRRDVFVLYRFRHLRQAEIARQLGISTTMVEKHLMKAMAHCRKRLMESGP